MALRLKRIGSFEGKYHFLSNFHPSVVQLDGVDYPTVEHAYQAAKHSRQDRRERIRGAATPGLAKKLGRKWEMRDDWDSIKVIIMFTLVSMKFSNSPELQQALIDTMPAELVEGNTWGDKFWGQVDGKGRNELGKILMMIRVQAEQGKLR